ncbi:MAG: helix-turn-helix domain-containing protein [Butyrivibrio sp.]|nr:helix-turn-helix domain-containing protein [Butyrivibrio sp.]
MIVKTENVKNTGDTIMKYRDLRLSFKMSDIDFMILSIGEETILTPFPKHSHSKNSYELHYIKSGRGTLIADSVTYNVGPGSFFVTGPGVFHEQISDMDDPMVEYGMYLQVSTAEVLRRDNTMAQFINTPFFICDAGQEPALIMEEIFRELREKRFGYELMLNALIEQFLITITRFYENRTVKRKKGTRAVPADMTYLTIEEAFLYDYKDLTLPELARRVNLGIRQTQRLLNKHYNLTFSQKKDEARMSAALLLLKGTNKSVGEISEELGFSSPEHFTNSFKKYFGKTPGAYRKKSVHFDGFNL